ncbi:MAG: cupredoxin domain-containing protein [Dehalococcoidia bacterium]
MSSASMEPTESVRSWRRVEIAGLAAVSAGLVLVLIINMAAIPPVIVFAVLYGLLAVAVWRFSHKTWVPLVAGVLALLGMLANAPFLAGDLAHPDSWGSFIPSAIALVGALVAFIAAVTPRFAPEASFSRPLGLGGAAVAIVLVGLSITASATASSDALEEGDVAVIAEGVEYPEVVLVASGGALHIENKDPVHHTFVIDDTDIKVDLPAGKSRRLDVALASGEYRFLCDVPGHERMEGTLTVE